MGKREHPEGGPQSPGTGGHPCGQLPSAPAVPSQPPTQMEPRLSFPREPPGSEEAGGPESLVRAAPRLAAPASSVAPTAPQWPAAFHVSSVSRSPRQQHQPSEEASPVPQAAAPGPETPLRTKDVLSTEPPDGRSGRARRLLQGKKRTSPPGPLSPAPHRKVHVLQKILS